MSVSWFVYLFVFMFGYICLSLHVCLSVGMFACLFVLLPVCSVCLSVLDLVEIAHIYIIQSLTFATLTTFEASLQSEFNSLLLFLITGHALL